MPGSIWSGRNKGRREQAIGAREKVLSIRLSRSLKLIFSQQAEDDRHALTHGLIQVEHSCLKRNVFLKVRSYIFFLEGDC